MAQDNLARLERIERRLRALEDAEAIRNLKARYAALCDKQYDADGSRCCSPRMHYGKAGSKGARRSGLLREASGIFSFAIHYSLNGHIEVEGDTAQAQWYLFMPCTVTAGNQAM